MKKMIGCFFLFLIMILVIVGCSNQKNVSKSKKVVSGHTVYVCKNTEDTSGLKSLTSYSIEVDKDNIPVQYILVTGYGNYGDNIAGYEKFCNGLKEGLSKQSEIETYKDVAQIEVTCDEKNLEAYVTKTYDVQAIKDIEYFKAINEYLAPYINEDGTFNSKEWKKFYNTDSVYKGKFTCDF